MKDERTETQEDQENQEESDGTSTDEKDESTTSAADESDTSSDDTADESNDQDSDDDTSAASEDGLTEAERIREEELRATLKQINDEKSALGRKRKELEAEARIQAELEKETTTDTDDTDFPRPTKHWKNEDGTIDPDALVEWNFYTAQQQQKRQDGQDETIKELTAKLATYENTDKVNKEFLDYQKRFNITKETYDEYVNIRESVGEIDAIEFLGIQSKKSAALTAAQEQRELEKSGMPPTFTANGSPKPTPQGDTSVQALIDEGLKKARGNERMAYLQNIKETQPDEIASVVISAMAQAGA